jgi:hypothetical protein
MTSQIYIISCNSGSRIALTLPSEALRMKHKTAVHGLELVALGETSLRRALMHVVACESCSATVSRSFGSVLSEVLGPTNSVTEYILCAPVRCPNCSESIIEGTLVRCDVDQDEVVAITDRDFEPTLEATEVILIDEPVLREAQGFVAGCGHCIPSAEMTFDYILDEVTGCDPTSTEYVLCHPAKCPRCAQEITEKTLVVA